jgi:hypothetical protein
MNQSIRGRVPDPLKRACTWDALYFLSYGLFLVTSLLSTTFYYRYFIGYPLMWMQIICVALLAAYEVHTSIRWGQNWIGLVIVAGMSCIGFAISDGNLNRLVPLMILYIYSARNIHFAKIARFSLNVSIAVVGIVVLSGYLGIIDNVVTAKGSRVREVLGFRYALFLPGILLNMTGLWIYLNKRKLPIVGSLVWAAVNLFVYIKTDSRISFALAILLLVLGLAMRFLPKVTEKIQIFWGACTASFAACGIGSLVMTLVYNSAIPWMRRLNSMLESRLSLGKKSLDRDGVTFFSRHISWVGNGLDAFGNSSNKVYTYVDCLYVKILQRYGILFFSALLGICTWAMYKLWKLKEYHILLICVTVAVHCILDDLSFALHYNTFWIAMGVALLNPNMLRWADET